MSQRSLRSRILQTAATASLHGLRNNGSVEDESGSVALVSAEDRISLENLSKHLADVQRIARLDFWQLDLDSLRVHLPPPSGFFGGGSKLDHGRILEFSQFLEKHVHPDDHDRLWAWAQRAKSGEGKVDQGVDYRTVDAQGEVRHFSANSGRRAGEEQLLFMVAQDVTERRRIEDELLRGSLYDPLTGLPNRNLVLDRLSIILGRSGPSRALCTFAILDLDRFGAIKASLGTEVADGLILGLAVRLVGALPPGTTVGRMSHHEFAVVIEGTHEDLDLVMESLRDLARTPLPFGGRGLFLTGSVGVASAFPGDCLAEALVARSESAVYQASVRGGDCVVYFDPERSRQAKDRLDLEMDLGESVRTQLELHYQPIVKLSTGTLAGFEALVRWRHPTRGMISPAIFIPIAERSGIIHEIGLWVMEEAMRKEASWQAKFGSAAPFMSINLSVRQFHHDDLSERIRQTILKTGVQASGIKLEITESALSEDPQRVANLLDSLCSTGLGFSLDDFGTGYSSLGYLSRFPVQTLKVDKSFVDELGQDEKKTRITAAIVNLAHTLGMDVVAEGIETEIQRERLLALGCEYGQGYLFSKPLPDAIAEEFLMRGQSEVRSD
jgi:diguanylate cyclase (GGDEF)-like protein